jgi:Spy/CpxP family protein refolding chaperone
MRIVRFVVVVCVIALLLQTAVAAQGGRQGGRQGNRQAGWQSDQRARILAPLCASGALVLPGPQMLDNLATKLELTDEQKQKLTTAMDAAKTRIDPLRTKVGEAVTALRTALFDADKDSAALKTLSDAASKAEADLQAAELAAWQEIRSILTKDQLEKLGEAVARPRRLGSAPGGPAAPPDGAAPPPPPPPAGE